MRLFTLVVLLFLNYLTRAQAHFSFTVINLSGTNSITCNTTGLNYSVSVEGDISSLTCVWEGPTTIQGFSATLLTVGVFTMSLSSGTTTLQQIIPVFDGRVYPVISAGNGPFTISCPSGTVDLTADVLSDDPISFSWYNGMQNGAIGNGSVITVSSPGQYAVVVTNQQNGCATKTVFDVWACVGPEKQQKAEEVCKIFPNPVKDRFWLSYWQEGTIMLYDLSGKIVKTWNTGESSFLIGDCPDGFYSVRLEGDGSVSWVTLVVSRE